MSYEDQIKQADISKHTKNQGIFLPENLLMSLSISSSNESYSRSLASAY